MCICTTNNVDMENVSICTTSSVDVLDVLVSLSTPSSMDLRFVSFCTTSSRDVQGVSFPLQSFDVQGLFIPFANRVDIQGVSISTASTVYVLGVSLSTISSVGVQGVSLYERAWYMPPHRQLCRRAGCFFFNLNTVFYARTPDCLASDHSSTGMKKNLDAGTSPVPEPQFGTGILRYPTEMLNADAGGIGMYAVAMI
jgi:hypothetical protein